MDSSSETESDMNHTSPRQSSEGLLRLVFAMLAVVLTAALAAAAYPATSVADARPELLWQSPSDLASGSSAGRMEDLRGMDVLPSSGNLVVVDQDNARIDEFTAWGEFVKAWGWGVRDGLAELQTCGPGAQPPTSTCLPGIVGTGAGQLPSAVGVAIGGDDSIYVYEGEECEAGDCRPQNFRVQKFNAGGEFVLMFGGEVNKTKSTEPGSTPAERNLCTEASGDTCGIGVLGTGPGEFSNRSDLDAIDVGPGGTIFVGDAGRIQAFEPSGAFKGEVVGSLAGEVVRSLAVDSTGNFFGTLSSTYQDSKPDVRKLDPLGVAAGTLPVNRPGAIAIDDADNLFVTETIDPVPGKLPRVVKFAADGEHLIPDQEEREKVKKEEEVSEVVIPAFAEAHQSNFSRLPSLATSSGCGIEQGADVYVGSHYQNEGETYVSAYGPAPDPAICPPPAVPPTIDEQFATAVTSDGATLKAKINPHFWPDTTYYVEYGTGKCSEGGCTSKTPVTELGPRVVGIPVTTAEVLLEGLAVSTTYHYRFVAQSGGGGPVLGGGPGEEGGSFTTTSAPPEPEPDTCPNAVFRVGPSSLLEDCRAYEMVSPVDKSNGDILPLPDPNSNLAAYNQASVDGARFGYSSYRAFGEDVESAPYISQYLASRTGDGWISDGISPARGVSLVSGEGLQTEYRFFSPDLCAAWLFHDSDPKLAEGAIEGFSNFYKRDLCGSGGYEAVTTTQPTCSAARNYLPELQGVAADGAHVAFRVPDKLTNNAAACAVGTKRFQCYESSSGSPLRLINVLPSGVASTGNCTLGSAAYNAIPFRFARVESAISDDGSRVYWTDLGASADGPGKIYVRVNATQAQSPVSGGVCTNAARACTLPVGEGRFWWATPDGSRALYVTSAGELEEFDLATSTSTGIAGEVRGLLGASDNGTKIYLASAEELAPGAPAEGTKLYLYQAGGGFTYIATLASPDLPTDALNFYPSPITFTPFNHRARVTPDGMHAVFMSSAALTGEENRDAQSGQPDAEVFVYDADSKRLSCASCLATGQRPSGRELRPFASTSGGQPTGVWAASQIQGYPTQLRGNRVLSADGQRLFFESFQGLVSRDTNNKQDVYEWEAPADASGPTSNTCTESSPAYRPANDGCISLISSGTSGIDSEFLDASVDGSDVFFTTNSSLVSSDPGLIDVYDARVQGGFPPPPPPTPPCQGEGCQSPAPPPPVDPAPASSTFHGPGDLLEKKPKPCRKGKVRKHGRCVKKHRAGKKKRHGTGKAGQKKGARR